MKKKPTVRSLKKKLWTTFSLYIRMRNANYNGYVMCVTCGIKKHYKQMQAGHFLPGRRNSVLFDPRNCHSQCYACNCMKYGNTVKYFRYMQDRYGDNVIKDLEKKDTISKQFDVEELEDMIDYYKEKLKCLQI